MDIENAAPAEQPPIAEIGETTDTYTQPLGDQFADKQPQPVEPEKQEKPQAKPEDNERTVGKVDGSAISLVRKVLSNKLAHAGNKACCNSCIARPYPAKDDNRAKGNRCKKAGAKGKDHLFNRVQIPSP